MGASEIKCKFANQKCMPFVAVSKTVPLFKTGEIRLTRRIFGIVWKWGVESTAVSTLLKKIRQNF